MVCLSAKTRVTGPLGLPTGGRFVTRTVPGSNGGIEDAAPMLSDRSAKVPRSRSRSRQEKRGSKYGGFVVFFCWERSKVQT